METCVAKQLVYSLSGEKVEENLEKHRDFGAFSSKKPRCS